ncbi:MAG: preprotein translocase subunit SecG [Bdellovibrionota bacterium]
MIQFVTIIHVVICILLIIVVLLQQGKKDGMGAAFGGGSSSVFGARGAETFLEKLTKILAIVFMCTSLSLVYFASRESSGSLLSDEKVTQEAPASTESETVAAPADPAVETSKPAEKAASDTQK